MGQYERQAQSQRKHGPLSVSGAAKAPAPPPAKRPDWRGSGYVKKRPSRQQHTASNPTPIIQEQLLPVELQQLILNIFRDTFLGSRDFDDLKPTLQEINNALLERNLENAFDSEERLEVYALRWSPSRSLAYSNVLIWLCDQQRDNGWVKRLLDLGSESGSPAKAFCFGGGAAEVMAYAGLLRHFRTETSGRPQQSQPSEVESASETPSAPQRGMPMLEIQLSDAADWTSVVSKLETGLVKPPILSKYASATARSSNAAFISPHTMGVGFLQTDVLSLKTEELQTMTGNDPVMATFFLTLNDLYTTSIPRTTAFLRKLDAVLPKDSLLLVVDSIGASSAIETDQATPGRSTETHQSFPMDWLLDRALLGKPQKDDDDGEPKPIPRWEKIVQENMRQHKLDEKLRYPGSLENMKFQLHAFKRV